jgi:DNA primase
MAEDQQEAARLTALASAGAAALRTAEQWRSLLYRTDQFGHLGFTNTMLIWAQCPDAVVVHDYAAWKKLGRQVIRGERGIRILADRGHVTTVFDLLQTTGEPQPVLINRTDGHGKPGAESWQTLARLVWPDPPDGDAVRHLTSRLIAEEGEAAAAANLARRVGAMLAGGHVLAGRVEAESVAFLIALRLGFGTSLFSFPSVTSWAGADPRARADVVVAATWERIVGAAARATAAIDLHVPAVPRLVTGPRLASRSQGAGARLVPPKILETAARYYARRLTESWVPGYLVARGFDDDVLRRWGIGYAPGGWTTLTDHLRGLRYQDAAIEAAGLAQRSKRGTLIDVFRDRAVFPVRSADGSVIGFLGRAAPGAQAGTPKYLNTRETEFYHKGDVLFGLHEAGQVLGGGGRAVIVEGPLDAIAVSVAGDGRYAGVAPCGTALTAEQVAALQRAGGSMPVLAFDGDQAGRKAAVRAYPLMRDADALVAEFPEGLDPAELLATRGAPALLQVLDELLHPLADVAIDAKVAAFEHWLEFIEGKFNALHAVAPLIAGLPGDQVARQVGRVAQMLELTHAEVTAAVADAVGEACCGADQSEPAVESPRTLTPLRADARNGRDAVSVRSASSRRNSPSARRAG